MSGRKIDEKRAKSDVMEQGWGKEKGWEEDEAVKQMMENYYYYYHYYKYKLVRNGGDQHVGKC